MLSILLIKFGFGVLDLFDGLPSNAAQQASSLFGATIVLHVLLDSFEALIPIVNLKDKLRPNK